MDGLEIRASDDFQNTPRLKILSIISGGLIFVFLVLPLFFWVTYFVHNTWWMKKKLKSLQRMDNLTISSQQLLKHTRIGYIKSIYILTFLVLEFLGAISVEFLLMHYFGTIKANFTITRRNCEIHHYEAHAFTSTSLRINVALNWSINFASLAMNMLPLIYLAKAYGYKFYSKNLEATMIIFIILQSIAIFVIKTFRFSFFLLSPLVFILGFINVCLYNKFSRVFYHVLRERVEDARFEDVHIFKELDRMKKIFRAGNFAFRLYLSLCLLSTFYLQVWWWIETLVQNTCIIQVLLRFKHLEIPSKNIINSSKIWDYFIIYITPVLDSVFLTVPIVLYGIMNVAIFVFCFNEVYKKVRSRAPRYGGLLSGSILGERLIVK